MLSGLQKAVSQELTCLFFQHLFESHDGMQRTIKYRGHTLTCFNTLQINKYIVQTCMCIVQKCTCTVYIVDMCSTNLYVQYWYTHNLQGEVDNP
jgi:hypothetical protein